MKKSIAGMLMVLLLTGGLSEASAQGWLNNLGKSAVESAKRATERNVENKTTEAVNRAFDKTEEAVKNNGNNSSREVQSSNSDNEKVEPEERTETVQPATPQAKVQAPEMVYAKCDFVAGDEIFFDDNLAGEQVGEFPSQWDQLEGNAEIAKMNGENVIIMAVDADSQIEPLLSNAPHYLPDKFTMEFDYYIHPALNSQTWRDSNNGIKIRFEDSDGEMGVLEYYLIPDEEMAANGVSSAFRFWYKAPGNEDGRDVEGKMNQTVGWNHFALSFNKRAMKCYINGTRISNIPNIKAPSRFYFDMERFYLGNDAFVTNGTIIKNVRLAKGAVPLYDRMVSEGKFITYGITFDIGKSTIKPESMGEINRIVTMMNEKPELKFSVEGHTDNTGSEAGNQTLSEARSKAIVSKLTELGIAASRLTSSGKGQSKPIADNATDEGRAKNRRVEFVKI